MAGAEATLPLIEKHDPDAVVVDILTTAEGLAAQVAGRRWATCCRPRTTWCASTR